MTWYAEFNRKGIEWLRLGYGNKMESLKALRNASGYIGVRLSLKFWYAEFNEKGKDCPGLGYGCKKGFLKALRNASGYIGVRLG